MSYKTSQIRNVVLTGHQGSGKTTFAECMLFEAGKSPRRGSVQDGSTTSDYTNIEKNRGNSIFTSLMHCDWKDSKINILDTPGADDFVGEVISTLKVTDTAIMVINASQGVEVGTELTWEYLKQFNTPSLFVINQIDHEKADFQKCLEQLKSRFGNKILPLQYPLREGLGFDTIVDALQMIMYKFPEDGGVPEKVEIPDSEIGKTQEMHNAIIEVAAENDEELMEKFFDEGSLTEEELKKGLNIAISKREAYPVFIASSERNMGSGRIMGFINDICPSPEQRHKAVNVNEEEIIPDQNDDPVMFIYKTMSEPQVGNVSYFKVFSGTVQNGDVLYNHHTGTTEKIQPVFISEGKKRTPQDEIVAGDIGVTVKLKNSHTNQTLSPRDKKVTVKPIKYPTSKLRVGIKPPSKSEVDKLSKALHNIQEEDPTLHFEHNPELKQMILHAQGQLQVDILKYRLQKLYGLDLEFERPKVPYRETIHSVANTDHRHRKQTGGSGQFAEVHMRVEPFNEDTQPPADLTVRNAEEITLPWGGTLNFVWCITGGAIDTKYKNAIIKGLKLAMEEGPITGSPCIDVQVSVYDGKMHSVDSNDMAFQIAASTAFKKAFSLASPVLLEPIYDLTVLCDEDVMGEVMSDLQSRRAMIMGMDSEGHYQKIIARIPLRALYKYNSTLRSLTQGKAKFERAFAQYNAVDPQIQKELQAQYESEPAR